VKRLLSERNIAAVGFFFALTASALIWEMSRLSERLTEQMALGDGAIQTSSILEMRELYTSDVVARLLPLGVKVAHDFEIHAGAIPLPATFTLKLGDRISRHLGIQVKLYSDYPFPWRKDRAPLDDFQRQAIAELRRRPDAPFYRFETFQGAHALRYATADRMKPQCLQCHNTHPQSPKRDWEVGDVRGALEISRPITGLAEEIRAQFRTTFLLASALTLSGILGLVAIAIWLRKAALELTEMTTQLKTANEELETFNSALSHDLRAPLTTLKGFSQVLLENQADRLDAQGRECVSAIAHDVDRMSQLINDMLNLSQAEHAALKRERVDLSRMASSITSELLAVHRERKVDFIIGRDLTAHGDSSLLRVALENLIGNAWKYTSKRDRALIEFGKTPTRGADAFFVRDNGAGFDMAQSSRLFTAFQRLHSDVDFPGTGIGLATVRRIIERHDGKIWAEGELGKGATVYFTLPEIS